MIYLDYCATTPIDNDVLDTYIKVTKNFFANTSSLHKLGQESNYMYEKAISEIKEILNVKNHDIVFTSNATEANNLAIFGVVNKYKSGKIITTKMEHPSVYEVMKSLQNTYEVVFLDVDKNGLVDIEQLRKELTKDTILVSVMWVNNILGTIQKIQSIIEILKVYPKTKLHVDAVQGICKIVPDFNFNDIDLFTFSTHKFYGPKGIGGLVFKHSLELERRLYGSSAQYNLKPGTFDLSLIVSTAKALKIFYPQAQIHQEYVKMLFTYLYGQLKTMNNIIINTPLDNISYYVLNVSIPSVNGETLVHSLEQNEIYVSTGSACSSKLKKPEKTIYAMTNDESLSLSSVRMSFSHLTTLDEINKLIESLKRL